MANSFGFVALWSTLLAIVRCGLANGLIWLIDRDH